MNTIITPGKEPSDEGSPEYFAGKVARCRRRQCEAVFRIDSAAEVYRRALSNLWWTKCPSCGEDEPLHVPRTSDVFLDYLFRAYLGFAIGFLVAIPTSLISPLAFPILMVLGTLAGLWYAYRHPDLRCV